MKTITLHIKLDNLGIRLLLLVVLLASLGGSIALAKDDSSTAGTLAATGSLARRYYLTKDAFQGNEVLTACAAGYHIASIWEILDPSNLVYDTDLGFSHYGGDGTPPTNAWGWIRTGGMSGTALATGSNCAVWTSNSNSDYGTLIALPNDWSSPGSTMGVWKTFAIGCGNHYYVWCAGD